MSLKHVLLVVLSKQPSTGYEITKWFDGPLGYFWNTSHQRVYRALATLHEDGWVAYEVVHQSDKPDKKIYRITEQGLSALQLWLAKPLKPTPINESFLVKLFASEHVDPAVLRDELKAQLDEFRQLLQTYQRIEKQFFPDGFTGNATQDMMYLTLRRGLYYQQSNIAWAEESLHVMNGIVAQSAPTRAE